MTKAIVVNAIEVFKACTTNEIYLYAPQMRFGAEM